MNFVRGWTLVLGLIFLASVASASLFPFIKCTGGECQLCLASSVQGANKVCSKNYSSNPGANDPTPGIANISRELTDDLTNQLVKVKELPKEGFDVKEFYEKFTEYSCDQADREIEFIQKQIEYLHWKLSKIEKSKAAKVCSDK